MTAGKTANPESRTRLLINSRTDVALASRANGVHLRSDDISPQQVRDIWSKADGQRTPGYSARPVIAVSCHTPEEVNQAAENAANFAVFAPVFEKQGRYARRPRPAPPSLPRQHPSARSRWSHAGQRAILPASGSRRDRRNPALPGKQHRRSSAQTPPITVALRNADAERW